MLYWWRFAHPVALKAADLRRRRGKGRGCYSDGLCHRNGGDGEYYVNNCLVVYYQELIT